MTWESGCANCCAPFKTQKVVQKVVVPKTTARPVSTSNNCNNSKESDKFKSPRKKFKVVDIISKMFNLESPQSKLVVTTVDGGEDDYVPGKKSYFPLCGVCADISMKLYKLYEQLETRRHKNSQISFKIKERDDFSSTFKIGPGPWVKVNRLQSSMNNISSTRQQQEEQNNDLLQENMRSSDHDNSPLCNDDDDENFTPGDEDHSNNDSSSSEKVSLPTPRKSSKNKSSPKSLKNKSSPKSLKNKSPRKSKILKKIKESSSTSTEKKKKESTVPETPSVCPLCPTTLDTLTDLVNHIRYTHTTKEAPLTCPICQTVTSRKITLRRHLISIHLRPTIFPCPSCDKSYSWMAGLRQHSLTHLAPEFARRHLCHECGKGFSTAAKLKIHSVSHTGEARFECPDCPDKKFRYADNLKAHRLKCHSIGPIPNKSSSFLLCPVCGKQIARATMTIHMRIHDGTKPYECPAVGCIARFRQQSQRDTHLLVHTGERPFVCPNSGCRASFTQRPSLKKHMIIHVGDRPYKCLVENCGASFGDTGQLTYHRRVHQIGEASIDPPSFSCVKCECKFVTKRAKKSHEAVCES